jgi:hypothetical protein
MVAIIFVWEFGYSFLAVKPNKGQQFRIFYDYNISALQSAGLINLLEEKETFSYEILKLDDERVVQNSDVLSTRNEVGMTDVLVTEINNTDTAGKGKPFLRGKGIIDAYKMYPYDRLIKEAKEYVDTFKTNGTIDDALILAEFNKRLSDDNRFRTAEEKELGFSLEKQRILKLESDIAVVEKLFEYDAQRVLGGYESLFFTYKRFDQIIDRAETEEAKNYYLDLQKNEVEENYGLKAWLLTGGSKNPANFFSSSLEKEVSCKNVILTIFDMTAHKGGLRFETVSFIAMVVKEFTNIAG